MKTETAGDSSANFLSAAEYVDARTTPSIGHGYYLCCSDLARVIGQFAAKASGKLFDYGCGGSPYQPYFKNCSEYVRADVTPNPGIHRLLTAEGLTDEPTDHYDVVISTQVLEHVGNAPEYIEECYRILKPGGSLLVTTHGMFEEHACPNDYYRWTSMGLERLIKSKGFQIEESYKLTTDLRGIIQLMFFFAQQLRYPSNRWVHFPLVVMGKIYNWIFSPVLNRMGKALSHQGVVPASNHAGIYVGIAVVARKPEL